jgi:hypothetical protein
MVWAWAITYCRRVHLNMFKQAQKPIHETNISYINAKITVNACTLMVQEA